MYFMTSSMDHAAGSDDTHELPGLSSEVELAGSQKIDQPLKWNMW